MPVPMRRFIFIAMAILLVPYLSGAKQKIDFDKTRGVINAVNGIGQPPVTGFANTVHFHSTRTRMILSHMISPLRTS